MHGYFGYGIYLAFDNLAPDASISSEWETLFISGLAILLSFVTLIDILVSRSKRTEGNDKKTDWFYKNKDYDRKLDDRADKNNYRIN